MEAAQDPTNDRYIRLTLSVFQRMCLEPSGQKGQIPIQTMAVPDNYPTNHREVPKLTVPREE